MITLSRLRLVVPACVAWLAFSSAAQAVTETFNTSTNWTVPAGVTSVTVEAWGGGGNGAGFLTHGGGGGGGAYARSTLTTSPGTVYSIVVGGPTFSSYVRIGGGSDLIRAAAGASATTSAGALGGATSASLGSVLFAGGRGASASNDGLNNQIGGGGGGSAFTTGAGDYIGITTSSTGGNGTGRGGAGGTNGSGNAGQSPGGGGGGSADNFAGAAGATGRVVFTYEIQLPEINLLGNGLAIAHADSTPSLSDHTDFGTVPVSGGAAVRVFTIQNTGNGVLTLTGNPVVASTGSGDFTITQPAATALNPGSSTTFQVTFDPSAPGLRTAALSIVNNDSNENPYQFSLQGVGGAPEIAITQAGVDRASGATVPFGGVAVGESADLTFVIQNSGGDVLLLNGTPRVAVTGGQGAFTVVTQPTSAPLPGAGATSSFVVRFAPVLAGATSATLTIANSDADEASFVLQVTATGLSSANDTDADGLNDVAELKLSALGFDWQTNQSALVSTYFAHAAEAGLYTAAQLQALHPGTPLLERDPATGRFRLILDWRRTTNLSSAFEDFPAPPASTATISPSGDVVFEFPETAPVIFYRVVID